MNRRLFITGAGAGLMTMMLGGCNFMSKNEAQQKSVAQAATDSSTSTGNKNKQLIGTDKKILIAYFSHTGICLNRKAARR